MSRLETFWERFCNAAFSPGRSRVDLHPSDDVLNQLVTKRIFRSYAEARAMLALGPVARTVKRGEWEVKAGRASDGLVDLFWHECRYDNPDPDPGEFERFVRALLSPHDYALSLFLTSVRGAQAARLCEASRGRWRFEAWWNDRERIPPTPETPEPRTMYTEAEWLEVLDEELRDLRGTIDYGGTLPRFCNLHLAGEIKASNWMPFMDEIRAVAEQLVASMITLGLATPCSDWIGESSEGLPKHDLKFTGRYGNVEADTGLGSRVTRRFEILPGPMDDSETERRAFEREPGQSFLRRISKLGRLFASETEERRTLRRAAVFDLRALQARDPGEAAFYLAACLEALALEESGERQDLQARTMDATAAVLGRSRDEREDIRKLVKATYKVRSAYVHGSGSGFRDFDEEGARRLVRRFLQRRILDLPGDDQPETPNNATPAA